jgi:hypothetical protein
MPEAVELFVYDLSNGMAQSLGPMLVGRPVEDIWVSLSFIPIPEQRSSRAGV